MFRPILSVVAFLFLSSSAMAADPLVTKLEWTSDLGGQRYFTVAFGDEKPTPAQSDFAAAMIKAISLAEGYTLDGTSGSSPGNKKTERTYKIGYKKAGANPVLVKVEFVNQLAGSVKYKFTYSEKADATTVTKHAETLARAAYSPAADDLQKVKAKTETTIDGKKAEVTVTFSGGAFGLIK